jgi:hypothetical protein
MTRTILPLAVIIVGVAGAVWLGVEMWQSGGSADISWQGWLAMGLGTLATVLLGGGLMTLVFYSSRQGYDDRVVTLEPPPPEPEPDPAEW